MPNFRLSPLLSCLIVALAPHGIEVRADTPLGWIDSNIISAYTTTRGELEISASLQTVDDTVDILNIRDDLLASNPRLTGDSGDLIGRKLELHYGLSDSLSVFARLQEHELTVDVGPIASINVLDISDSLQTTQQELGVKWTLYRSNLLNPDNRQTAVSLQLTGFKNRTDNFDISLDKLTFSNVIVTFVDPTTFSVSNMEDEGWTARLLFTHALEGLGIGSLWAGYGTSDATSGTSTDAVNGTIRRLFTQDFSLEEEYFYLGASFIHQITPRLPLSINYEFINISSSNFERFPAVASTQLPGILASSGPSPVTKNHTVNARLAYWLTPDINISLTGNLYSNQFLGRLPHYNNPLSESFASEPYGFIGAELGFRF